MFPEPTELLLIGCFTGSIWIQWFKSNTLTPNTNSQKNWQKEISHVMSGIIFCVCTTSAISVPFTISNRCRKRTQEDAGEERATAKSKPMMNLVSKCRVQQTNTVRLVVGVSSSDYSELNIEDKWFSQEWKSGEMLGSTLGRPVLVIDDHDLDFDTVTESNISLNITFILGKMNDRLRKNRCNSRHRQTFFDLGNVYVFDWKHLC